MRPNLSPDEQDKIFTALEELHLLGRIYKHMAEKQSDEGLRRLGMEVSTNIANILSGISFVTPEDN